MVRFWAKAITRGIFAVYLVWGLVRLWRIARRSIAVAGEPILEASARAFLVLILVVLTWVLSGTDGRWRWCRCSRQRLPMKMVVSYTRRRTIFYVPLPEHQHARRAGAGVRAAAAGRAAGRLGLGPRPGEPIADRTPGRPRAKTAGGIR